MGGTIKYVVHKRESGSYRIRKILPNGRVHISFNCLIGNNIDKIAYRDARNICAALNAAEAGRTVRAKRPVQQRKVAILRGCGNCKRNEDRSCDKLVYLHGRGFCSDHGYKYWKRSTATVA